MRDRVDDPAAFVDGVIREKEAPAWVFACPTSLAGKTPPPRRWIVDQWIGAGYVTINFGDGGTGKTLLMQQLMTSTATGRPWCGLAVERCRSLALFCEDDPDELHRRQDAINLDYGVFHEDLGDMLWTTGIGLDNTLAVFGDSGRMRLTEGFQAFLKRAEQQQPGLIVVDTASDTFGGNENIRIQVRQFVGHALGKLANLTGAAVVLNAHPSRAGMGPAGDMDGASTAWNATARGRLSLSRPKADAGEQDDPDARILTRRKSNYASIGDTIKLRWDRGVLVPVDRPTGLAAMCVQADADSVFLTLLARFTVENRPLSDSSHSPNYAPRLMAQRPDRQGVSKRDFSDAMQRLFAAGKIIMEAYGRAGDVRRRVAEVQNAGS